MAAFAGLALVLAPQALALGPVTVTPVFTAGLPAPATAVATGDINGDGLPDLVTGGPNSNQIIISTQNRSGGFQQAGGIGGIAGVRSLAMADFDGNHAVDIAVGFNNGWVTIYKNNGVGIFNNAATFQSLSGVPLAMAAGDFNGDGLPDLAVAQDGAANAWAVDLLTLGGGGLFLATLPGSEHMPIEPGANGIALKDLNGDSFPDVIVSSAAGNSVDVLRSAGSLHYQPFARYPAGNRPGGLVARDLDGDGTIDIAVADEYGGDVTVLRGFPGGTFVPAFNFPAGASPLGSNVSPMAVGAGDFNHDGLPDLVVSEYGRSQLGIHLNEGGLTFGSLATDHVEIQVPSQSRGLVVSDLSGDGLADVLVGSDTSAVSWLYGTNAGTPVVTFTQHPGIGPNDPTTSTTPTFAWTSDVLPISYTCQIDPNTAQFPCTSPYTTNALPAGFHHFYVFPHDLAGTPPNAYEWQFQIVATSTLSGSVVASPDPISVSTQVDLTAAGNEDWAIWGYANGGTSTSLAPDVRKAGGTAISNLTNIDPAPSAPLRGLGQFGGPFTFKWSDGGSQTSAVGVRAGIQHDGGGSSVSTLGKGFSFDVPAGTSTRTLSVYVATNRASGQLTASLSDGSAPSYVDTLPLAVDARSGIYTIRYAAASAGQTLHVQWVETLDNCSAFRCDNAAVYAVALSSAVVVPPPDTKLVTGPVFLGGTGTFTRSVAVTFGAISSDPSATVDCSVDGGGFDNCQPSYSLQTGLSHHIVGRAQTGSAVDPTPVAVDFYLPANHSNGRIAFQSDNRSAAGVDLYAITPGAGGAPVNLPSNSSAADSAPAYSPDGTTIAFSSTRGSGVSDIYLANADGSNVRQLTHLAGAQWPSWSPDGTTIAYSAGALTGVGTGIWKIPASGLGVATFLGISTGANAVDFEPHWSPDGRQIVFTEGGPGLAWSIWRIDADGTGLTFLKGNDSRDASYSPANDKIVYASDVPNGILNIWTMNTDGTGAFRVTNSNANIFFPKYSPDGSSFVYSQFFGQQNSYLIVTSNTDGSNPVVQTGSSPFGGTADDFPDWGPQVTVPQATFTSPTGGQHVAGVVRVKGTVTNPSNTEVSVLISVTKAGQSLWTQIGTANGTSFNLDWDTTGLAEGEYQLRATAGDSVGGASNTVENVTVDQLSNLVVDAPQPSLTIDPAFAIDALSMQIDGLTQAGLMALSSSNNGLRANTPVPELAIRPPDISANGTRYAFNLRDDFQWGTGYPVTSYDVKRGFERALAPGGDPYVQSLMSDLVGAPSYAHGASSIDGIATPDSNTIVFTLTRADADFVHRVAMPQFAAASPQAPPPGSGVAADFFDSAGPYVVVSHMPAVGGNPAQVVLQRNLRYPGTRGRTFDHITINYGVSPATALDDVRQGYADYYDGTLPAGAAASLNTSYGPGNSPQRLFRFPNPVTWYVTMNTTRAFSNPLLRRAVGYVLPRAALAATQGPPNDPSYTTAADGLIAPNLPGALTHDIYSNDVQKARDLVRQAGGPPDRQVDLYTCANPQCATRAQLLTDALALLEIRTTVHVFPSQGEVFNRIGTVGEPYDISTLGWGADWPDASNVFGALLDGGTLLPPPAFNTNTSQFNDPGINQRIHDANAITDPVARAQAWSQLDQLVIGDYAPILPYAHGVTNAFFSPRIGCQINSWIGIDLGTLCDRNHPVAPSNVSASIQTDASVGASGANVSVDSIPLRIFEPPSPNGPPPLPLNGLPLNGLPLNGMPLNAMPLNALAQKGLPLNGLPLNGLPLNGLAPDGTPLNGLPLNGLPLNAMPLNLPGGWAALLANTPLAGIPLQSVTLLDVFNLPQPRPAAIDALTLGDLDLAGSALGRVTLGALALGSTPLNALPLNGLPLNALADWCSTAQILVPAPVAAVLPGVNPSPPAPPTTTHCTSVLMGGTSLFVLALNGAPLNGLPLNAMPLNGLPLNGLPLNGLPLNGLDTSASPLNALPLNGLTLAGSPLNGLPLNALLTAHTPAPENGPTPLGLIRLASLTNPGAVVDCTKVDCTNGTLADAFAAQAIVGTATLGDIAGSLGTLTLGDLHYYGTLTIGDLVHLLPGTTLFGDVMALLVKRADVAWESLAPRLLSALDTSRPQLGLTAGFVLGGAGIGEAKVSVALPDGFDYVPGSSTLSDEGAPETVIGDPTVSGQVVTWVIPGATYGDSYAIRFHAYSGTTAGAAQATESVQAGSVTTSSTGTFSVGDTFEPNDNGGDVAHLPEITPNHSVQMSYVASGGDVDYYRVALPPAGDRLHVHLTNLSSDFDLALFTTQSSSVKTGTGQATVPLQDATIADTSINLQGGTNSQLAPTALQDVPDPGLQLVQVSANRGADDEDVGLVSPGGNGYAVIAVYGYQGATSPQPYTLRVTTSQTPTFQCTQRSFAHAGAGTPGVAPDIASMPADLNTLILVDQKRIGDTYGAGDAIPTTPAGYGQRNVTEALNRLAGDRSLGVSGAVVPVESLAQAQYDKWDSNPCDVSAANDAANLIANEIAAVQQARPTLKYVVFVGGGDQIPFFSIPDLTRIANENGWASNFGRNQYFATAASSDLLTDDPYLDTRPIPADGRQLFVPNLVGGRLGEKPDQIVAAIDRFESSQGKLNASTAFVSGYDFIKDGATRVAGNLDHIVGGTNSRRLINDTWSKSDLLSQAFPAVGSPADINTWNGHFDNANALPANGDHSQLISTADLDAKGAHALSGGFFFTMGCHAGFQTSDAIVGATSPDARDWAETFADHGASFAANTGFGLGNTDSVAFSEELMANLAANLDGSVSIGEALANAKATYFLARTAFSSYDEKTLAEAELYGLPMYGVGVSPAPLAAAAVRPQLARLSAPTPSPDPVRGAITSASPSQGDLLPLDGTAAQVAPFDVRPRFETDTNGVPTPRTGEHGSYFTNDGQVQAPNYRPLQPFVTLPASRPGEIAHGVLIDSLSSHDISNFNPDNVRPTVDLTANEPEPQFTEQAWPTKVPTLVSLEHGGSLQQSLNLTTGQFFTDAATNAGTERLWTRATGRVTYSSSSDFTPPSIDSVDAFIAGDAVSFTGHFSDLLETGAPGTVALAQIVYDVDNHGHWQSLPLQVDPANGAWSAGAAFTGDHVQYFVEACDLSGNCGFSSNKGRYFDAIPVPQPTGTISLTPDRTPNPSGWYQGDVHVSASSSAAATVLVSVDGGPFVDGPATVTGDGAHTIEARGSDASSATSVLLVDATKPEIDLQLQQTMRRGDEVHATYTCTDRGSGVAGCLGSTSSGGIIDTSVGGTFDYVVNATDIAGNTNQVTVQYTVIAGPTMPGAPTADKAVNNGSFTLSWAPATEHGYAITYEVERASTDHGPWTSVSKDIPAATAALTGETQGTWYYRVIATDGVVQSDPSPASGVVLVDTTAPTVQITSCPTVVDRGDAATLTFSATDTGGSGIAATSSSSGTIVLVTTSAGPHSQPVTVSDVAGNVGTASCDYRVNTPPLPTSAPTASKSPNNGAFTLSWQAPPDPDNDPLTFTVLHAPSPGGVYVIVGTTTAPTFAFSTASPETVGKWTYEIAVSDGHDSVLSPASATVIVDRTPPVLSLPTVLSANATSAAGTTVTFAPTATDAVDGSVPVTCAPASGSVFPIGDTIVSCMATDQAGNAATGYFTVRVLTYRNQISVLQAQIAAAAATATAPTSTRLSAAAARLADANLAIYWADSLRLQPPKGALVFADLELAADYLRLARGGSVPTPTLDGWAASIGRVADEIARTAVTDAIAAHGIAAKITAAQAALVSAQTATAAGNYYGAIVYDAAAWVLAEQAMKKLP